MDKEIVVIEKKVSLQEQKAEALVIKTEADMSKAVVMLSEVNKVADGVKTEKEKIVKPLNEALKAERARWAPIETACTNAVATIRQKMMSYQKKLDAEIAEKKAKIIDRVDRGTLRVETAVDKMEALPDAAASVMTTAGSIQWRTVKKLVITNEKMIPREYLDVNEVRIKEALKAGKVVPGAEMIEEKIPSNSR